MCSENYRHLYAAPTKTNANDVALEAILEIIPAKLSLKAQAYFLIPLTADELLEAAKAIASEQSPGLDGFLVTFFTKF